METQNSDNVLNSDPRTDGDQNTKKVRFKGAVDGEDTNMVVDFVQQPNISFQDKLLGGSVVSDRDLEGTFGKNEGDFELLEGDVNTSMVDGIPAIAFSDRIKDILFKEMELTVVLKLLGRNIGYNVLHNRILNLWKPTKSFHLMEITNGILKIIIVLTQDPWIIFAQYLTVQSWTQTFNPAQPYPSVVMAWIRLSGLPGYLYKRKIIEAIGGLIGKVVKLDLQTDNRTRGQFARLAVFINLDKPLVSQVLVESAVQRALPTVCFSCGKYGHVKELCPSVVTNSAPGSLVDAAVETSGDDVGIGGEGKRLEYGPWMLVKRKSRRGQRVSRLNTVAKSGRSTLGSRFLRLTVVDVSGDDLGVADGGLSGKNDVGKEAAVERSFKAKVSSKGDLGSGVVVGRGSDAGVRISVGPAVGPSLAHAKVVDARRVGLETGKIEGPMEISPGHAGRLAPKLTSSGLDRMFLNGSNTDLDEQTFGGIDSNSILGKELDDHSGASKNTRNKLVHNNPIFDCPSETVRVWV
ncbi:leucine-rich repeat receptor-like protein kinase PEPR2 [Gossypium australe]|uniref:Leucine-rich repeat receptor-like protein kinase PEPR2 n=1 Tax=Gossypium australe TaxID=47621 RepID=A0A5B6WH52_9ROSI|nr:leucine-rich repeat receptor-like protein kinase PEPR2 [Gossypium australe]